VDKAGGGGGGGGSAAAAAAAAAAAESITATQSVRFVNGNVVRTAYLDDYPFPYYLVIRDTAALPDTLSDAVRQFFAAAGGSS
jgi:midasin